MPLTTVEEKLKPVSEWSLEKLQGLKLNEIMELFKTLEAPDFKEMDGEYAADLLDHGSPFKNFMSRLSVSNQLTNGKWLCKAFTPAGETEGHGYNSFDKWGKIRRKYRMKTSIVNSMYDGKPVFQLYYPAYNHLLGKIKMVDEVRKVKDGLYLGMGRWGSNEKQQKIPLPFTLEGPIAEFVGSDKEELFKING